MTFFENILKKRLGDATSTKGVSPDDLWAAIEQNLPPEEEVIPPVKWGKISWVLLGLFLALAISLSVVLRESTVEVPATLATESINEQTVTTAEKITAQTLEDDDEGEGVSTSEEELIAASENGSLNLQDEMSASDLLVPSVPTLEAQSKGTVPNSSASHQPTTSSVQANEEYEPENEGIILQRKILEAGLLDEYPENLSSTSEDDVKAVDKVPETTAIEPTNAAETIKARTTTAVRTLDRELQISAPVREDKELTIENFKAIIPVRQLRRPRAALGIFVGSNMLRHKYPSTATDDLADVLNATRGEALGQSAALEFGYRLRPGLKVYTGIELLKTHTTFRYTQQWDTVTLRNGQQVDAIATRRVQHNNRQTLLSVPLMLEKAFAAGRWEAGLAAGVSFNYLTQQTGRSLNALQQVVTYSSGDGTNLPAPNFYMSYQLRPSINYRLNDRMSVQARIDLRLQRYGKSALYELPVNSMLYGGSFGVVFGL